MIQQEHISFLESLDEETFQPLCATSHCDLPFGEVSSAMAQGVVAREMERDLDVKKTWRTLIEVVATVEDKD
jgi:hypothetical protein